MDNQKSQPFNDLDDILSTIAHALKANGQNKDASLLAEANITLREYGYDNWDGGTEKWSLDIRVPYPKYLSYTDSERAQLSSFIDDTIKPFLPEIGYWVNSQIIPLSFKDPDWRSQTQDNSEVSSSPSLKHVQTLIDELETLSGDYQLIRWQQGTATFLLETFGDEVADVFKSYADEANIWDDITRQKAYLDAFLIKNKKRDTIKPDTKYWVTNHFKLFISHLSSSKEQTQALKRYLKDYGISGFVAHKDIKPGKEWLVEIERALHSMDSLAAVITPEFSKSEWTDQEVGFAIGKNLLVIPIQKDTTPHGFISKYQAINSRGMVASEVAKEVFLLIANHPKTGAKLAKDLANQILESTTDSDAIQKLEKYRKFESLPRTQLEKIRANSKRNPIIYQSELFRDQLNKLLKDHNLPELEYELAVTKPLDSSNDDILF